MNLAEKSMHIYRHILGQKRCLPIEFLPNVQLIAEVVRIQNS